MLEFFQTAFLIISFIMAGLWTLFIMADLWTLIILIVPNLTYTVNNRKVQIGIIGRLLFVAWGSWCTYVWYTLI